MYSNSFYFLHYYVWSLLFQRSISTVGTSDSMVSVFVYFHRPFAPQAIVPHTCLFASYFYHTFRFRLFLDSHAHINTSFYNPLNCPLCCYSHRGMRDIGSTGERVAAFCAFPYPRTYSLHGLSFTFWARMRCSCPLFYCSNCFSYSSPVSRAEPACGFRLFTLLSLLLPCHFSFFLRETLSL